MLMHIVLDERYPDYTLMDGKSNYSGWKDVEISDEFYQRYMSITGSYIELQDVLENMMYGNKT